MNKFMITLLTFSAILGIQNNVRAADDLVKKDTTTSSSSNNEQVPESARDELVRLLTEPVDLEKDQELRVLRIQQLRDHIAQGLPDSPPKTPQPYMTDQQVRAVGDTGKSYRNVGPEELTNLALQAKRLDNNPDLANMTPGEIKKAAGVIMGSEDLPD